MVYVGQTINFRKRERCWQQIGYRYGNQRLTDDRNNYGLDNFETIILKECDDSELDRWEKHCIKILNTIYPNGYNINEGGVSGFNCSDETKNKISEANSGENNYWFGKKRPQYLNENASKKLKGIPKTEDVKKKMSQNSAKYWATHEMTKEHKNNIGKTLKGKFINDPNRSKRVRLYKDGVFVAEYPSRNEAGRAIGVRGTSIGNCCKGGFYYKGKWVNCHTVKGYSAKYVEDDDLNLVLN